MEEQSNEQFNLSDFFENCSGEMIDELLSWLTFVDIVRLTQVNKAIAENVTHRYWKLFWTKKLENPSSYDLEEMTFKLRKNQGFLDILFNTNNHLLWDKETRGVICNKEDMVNDLLEKQSLTKSMVFEIFSAMCEFDRAAMLENIFEKMGMPDDKDELFKLMSCCATYASKKCLDVFLKRDPNLIKLVDKETGRSLIAEVALFKKSRDPEQMVDYLISKGCSVFSKSNNYKTPLGEISYYTGKKNRLKQYFLRKGLGGNNNDLKCLNFLLADRYTQGDYEPPDPLERFDELMILALWPMRFVETVPVAYSMSGYGKKDARAKDLEARSKVTIYGLHHINELMKNGKLPKLDYKLNNQSVLVYMLNHYAKQLRSEQGLPEDDYKDCIQTGGVLEYTLIEFLHAIPKIILKEIKFDAILGDENDENQNRVGLN